MARRMSRSVRVPFAAPSVLAMAALLAACDDTPPVPRSFTTVAACESYYGQGNCDQQQGANQNRNQTPASNTVPGQTQSQQGGSGGGGGGLVVIPGSGGGVGGTAPSSALAGAGTTGSGGSFAPRPGAAPVATPSFAPRPGVAPLSVARGGIGGTAASAASAS